jgi:hypothetical protein
MIWVKDKTGRFARRPHYEPEELDAECELMITEFLRGRHGTVAYPISTDDLTVLIEQHVADLDLYANLSSEGLDVEGVTDFFPGKQPRVRVSDYLSARDGMANRFRTTLTHELGHVKFHTFMFDGAVMAPSLFPAQSLVTSNKCKRDKIIHASQTDWMEWQAGYACGAFLMPATALGASIRAFIAQRGITVARFAIDSAEGTGLIASIAGSFAVSSDAARVRLEQRGTLTRDGATAQLFG